MTDLLPFGLVIFFVGFVVGIIVGFKVTESGSLDEMRRTGHTSMAPHIRIVGHIEHEIRKDKWVREDME